MLVEICSKRVLFCPLRFLPYATKRSVDMNPSQHIIMLPPINYLISIFRLPHKLAIDYLSYHLQNLGYSYCRDLA